MAYSWESLWAKAVLFMQYANENDKETAQFGIWCALSFEILARSAIAYKILSY
ncbi:unnamed protein product [Commensalibacter communis]|uniref:hypothetical protein n=1 Tax=Commensalibacter communis TaxID=2972786 RepID=UPI0022FFAD14|nr:hypothetical protein [Commensalibacter communis]CAI3955252.1 unnamed protein product [Commensalibacter communis]